MFELQKTPERNSDKKVLAIRILTVAHKELEQLAKNNKTSIHEICNQMIYHCLDRDQLTGEKLQHELQKNKNQSKETKVS